MAVLTTWEGMPIPFPEGKDSRSLIHRLMLATEKASTPCFRLKRGRLYAAEVVGCVQIGRLRINILPKTDTAEAERDRDFLLNMMWTAGYLNRPHTGFADVRSSTRDPLEALISEVASEMVSAIRDGVPRRYEEKREDLSTIRGRIDFSKLSTRLPCDRVLLPVRHISLHPDNQLARCIKGVAALLYRLTHSDANRQMFASLLALLSEVPSQPLTLSQIDNLKLTALESHWTRSISVARLLLIGQSPDPTFAGVNQVFSMLFPLQHLFERAMRKILGATLGSSGVAVNHRANPIFLLQDPADKKGVLRLKPDYVLGPSEAPLAIADAKWKRVSQAGRAHGVSREDLYQVSAYMNRFNVSEALIFVPQASWMIDTWTKSYEVPRSAGRIHIVGVDIEKLVTSNLAVRSQTQVTLSNTLTGILRTPP